MSNNTDKKNLDATSGMRERIDALYRRESPRVLATLIHLLVSNFSPCSRLFHACGDQDADADFCRFIPEIAMKYRCLISIANENSQENVHER